MHYPGPTLFALPPLPSITEEQESRAKSIMAIILTIVTAPLWTSLYASRQSADTNHQ